MKLTSKIDHVRAKQLFLIMGKMCWSLRNVFFILSCSILLSGVVLGLVEDLTTGEGIYLALITATTIGYGDLSPDTWVGRGVAVYIGVNGLLLTGLVVSVVVRAIEMTFERDLKELREESPDTRPK